MKGEAFSQNFYKLQAANLRQINSFILLDNTNTRETAFISKCLVNVISLKPCHVKPTTNFFFQFSSQNQDSSRLCVSLLVTKNVKSSVCFQPTAHLQWNLLRMWELNHALVVTNFFWMSAGREFGFNKKLRKQDTKLEYTALAVTKRVHIFPS